MGHMLMLISTVPMMHQGDTYSFGERQRTDTSFKCSQTDNLQGGQTDAVPDPNMRLQRLQGTDRTDCDSFHDYSGNLTPAFLLRI